MNNDFFVQKEINNIVIKNMEILFILKNLELNGNIKKIHAEVLLEIKNNCSGNIENLENISDLDIL